MISNSKQCTISVLPEAEKLVADEVQRLRDAGQYANKKMIATNAIYAAYSKQGAA